MHTRRAQGFKGLSINVLLDLVKKLYAYHYLLPPSLICFHMNLKKYISGEYDVAFIFSNSKIEWKHLTIAEKINLLDFYEKGNVINPEIMDNGV